MIDFGLIFARDNERDCLDEFENGTGVERREFLAVESKGNRHYRTFGARTGFAVAGDFADFGVGKN